MKAFMQSDIILDYGALYLYRLTLPIMYVYDVVVIALIMSLLYVFVDAFTCLHICNKRN